MLKDWGKGRVVAVVALALACAAGGYVFASGALFALALVLIVLAVVGGIRRTA